MKSIRWTGITMAAAVCLMIGMAVSALDERGLSYDRDQIEQVVAPVALYPDALLAQVFMAATYPHEVAEASRWAQRNESLRGDSLADALDRQNWDASVKSLVPFPAVLHRMAENEAWTQDLGNAFLVQPNDMMGEVQRLRHRAHKAGNLKTSSYQRVVVVQQVIQIVPVSRQTIYVPAYNPMVVYGPGWSHPTTYYPVMMAPPPYYRTGNVISYGSGFPAGQSLFGAFDWNQHTVYYGPNFYQYPGYRQNVVYWQKNSPGHKPGGRNTWQHDPVHRGPDGYHNKVLDQKYGHGHPTSGGHSQQPNATSSQPGGHEQKSGDHQKQPKATEPQSGGHQQESAKSPNVQKGGDKKDKDKK